MKEKKHKKSANLVHKFAVKTLSKGVRGLNILVVVYVYVRADKLIYTRIGVMRPRRRLWVILKRHEV